MTRRPRPLALSIDHNPSAWACLSPAQAARLARAVAAALADHVELPAHRNAATILLSDDAHVRQLNKQWRGYDKATNVLSFPSPPPPSATGSSRVVRHLGDIVLAEQTVVREAAGLGISVGDHYRHLVLHGLLHLLGYDHEADGEAAEMEALETRVLATLGVADPYADSDPIPARERRERASRRAVARR